jgi:hypothetical protein
MTRDEWAQFDRIKNNTDVEFAMRARCEEQGHDWENGAGFRLSGGSVVLGVYMTCKWCGTRRR